MTQFKAQALAAAVKMATGHEPILSEKKDGTALLAFKKEELPQIRAGLEGLIVKAGKTKSDIDFSLLPVVLPIALKYLLPAAFLLLAGGAIIGYSLRK